MDKFQLQITVQANSAEEAEKIRDLLKKVNQTFSHAQLEKIVKAISNPAKKAMVLNYI